jgi:ribonucleoside-diphosphate reductase alpha chain
MPSKKKILPDERSGTTWKLIIGKYEPEKKDSNYIKAFVSSGEYSNGSLGEVRINLDKEGSTLKGLLDGFVMLLSIALQYGVPLEVIVEKFINVRFEPSGMTNDKNVPMASSFFDLLFRKIALRYLDKTKLKELDISANES